MFFDVEKFILKTFVTIKYKTIASQTPKISRNNMHTIINN